MWVIQNCGLYIPNYAIMNHYCIIMDEKIHKYKKGPRYGKVVVNLIKLHSDFSENYTSTLACYHTKFSIIFIHSKIL